jgi:hypothetical protein
MSLVDSVVHCYFQRHLLHDTHIFSAFSAISYVVYPPAFLGVLRRTYCHSISIVGTRLTDFLVGTFWGGLMLKDSSSA